jgi:hypothetical protein
MKKTLLFFSICSLSALLFSQKNSNERFDFGLSVGAVFPGKIQAADHLDFQEDETINFKNKTSLLIKAKTDYYFTKALSVGLCMNYVPIKLQDVEDYSFEDITVHMAEIDATFKGRFWLTDNFAFKPGISFGIRKTFSTEPNARELGMCLNVGVEGQYYLKGNLYLLCDAGFFTQPYGGVQDVAYVRAGPIFYTSLGIGMKMDK